MALVTLFFVNDVVILEDVKYVTQDKYREIHKVRRMYYAISVSCVQLRCPIKSEVEPRTLNFQFFKV